MLFFTFLYGGKLGRSGAAIAGLVFIFTGFLHAQSTTNSILSNPGQPRVDSTNAAPPVAVPAKASDDALPVEATPTPTPAPIVVPAISPSASTQATSAQRELVRGPVSTGWLTLGALLTLTSVGGFLLYHCGLTRAKNCGYTATVLLLGMAAGLIGYWMGGFAVQNGGLNDSHALVSQTVLGGSISSTEGLDHELGFMAQGHYWGLMGSAGFFLMTGETTGNAIAALFLVQATLLAITVAAALGSGLERGRLLALTIAAFLIGAVIYPLFANWVWGGGWLADLGRDYGLGHGFVDLAGAGVVHETAGTLALVIAIVLGPRYGKFGREKSIRAIPGHNVPYLVLGAAILFISWTAANAFASTGPAAGTPLAISSAGTAAMSALLAGAAGLMSSFFLAAMRGRRPEPARLCRGLLGGVVAVSACSAWIDPWAAFVIGIVAGLLVQGSIRFLEAHRIDDPTGAAAVHGTAGTWGVLAAGLFANGTGGIGMNGVDGPVRGLFFGGAEHQLIAQAIGCATDFVVVFILGYFFFGLIVNKVLGARVDLVDEVEGLDWSQTGALGYQSDIEPEESVDGSS